MDGVVQMKVRLISSYSALSIALTLPSMSFTMITGAHAACSAVDNVTLAGACNLV